MSFEGRKQVEITENHDATDADMLSLEVGDVLRVYYELDGKINPIVYIDPCNSLFKLCCYN